MYEEIIKIKSGVYKRLKLKYNGTDYEHSLNHLIYICEKVEGLSPHTLVGYVERLSTLFDYCTKEGKGFFDIDRVTIRAFIAFKRERLSIATINGYQRAYRRSWNTWIEDEIWELPDPMKGIKLFKEPKRIKVILPPESVQRVLDSFDLKTFEGSRNYLMTLFMWDGMLRKSEVLGIKLSDLNLSTGMVKVIGKGNKEGMVPLGVNTVRFINKYLVKWRTKYSGEHLLCMRNGLPVVGRNCNQIYERVSEKLKLHVHPHLFRHSAATYFIKSGGNIAILQRIMRHSSIKVTLDIYGHLSDEDTRDSYKLHSPASSLKIRRG